jgi:DNA-binding GntR family transcriptional regulator
VTARETGRQTLQRIWTIKATTLPSVLYRHIHGMIMSGAIEPRQKVNELAIAKALGVSRGPIREACRQLLQAGLLTFEAQRGFSVRSYSIAEADELAVVRAQLAELVGRLACARAKPATVEQLEEVLAAMRSAARARRRQAFYGHSFRFYEVLCDATGNRALKDFYLDLHTRIRLFRLESHRMIARAGGSPDEAFSRGTARRERVVAALRRGDPAEAARVMRANSEEGYAFHRAARTAVECEAAHESRHRA